MRNADKSLIGNAEGNYTFEDPDVYRRMLGGNRM
jgi:hypothetical protein